MDALWIAITAVGMTLVNLYLDILKPMLVNIWSVKADGIAWKLRCSLIATGRALWDMLKAAYKKGLLDAIIGVLIKMVKNRASIAVAKRVGLKRSKRTYFGAPGPIPTPKPRNK